MLRGKFKKKKIILLVLPEGKMFFVWTLVVFPAFKTVNGVKQSGWKEAVTLLEHSPPWQSTAQE